MIVSALLGAEVLVRIADVFINTKPQVKKQLELLEEELLEMEREKFDKKYQQ